MRGEKVIVAVLCALLIFGVLAIADVSLGQQKALADEATFNSLLVSDGYLNAFNSSYIVAHDAATGLVQFGDTFLVIGQLITATPHYSIDRAAVFFDTSSLPDNVYIEAATLSLYGYGDWSDTDFDITVVDGSPLNDPLVAADYGDLLNQTTSGGAFNTAGFIETGYNHIPLNAVGMGWISKTGMTKFGLRSSRDITPTVPSGSEFVAVQTPVEGPKLVVTYAYPTTSVPTLSQWGIIGMAIVFTAFLVWSVRRRWTTSADNS